MNLDGQIVGYDGKGNPISANEYIEDIELALKQFKEGTLETYTHEEVKRRILRRDNIHTNSI